VYTGAIKREGGGERGEKEQAEERQSGDRARGGERGVEKGT